MAYGVGLGVKPKSVEKVLTHNKADMVIADAMSAFGGKADINGRQYDVRL